VFSLVRGATEQSNKDGLFQLKSSKNEGFIYLKGQLDYERVNYYQLTIRVSNGFNLAVEDQVEVHVLDQNDNVPIFRDLVHGSVLEKEPVGTPVMQVRAFDTDGTEEHNQV